MCTEKNSLVNSEAAHSIYKNYPIASVFLYVTILFSHLQVLKHYTELLLQHRIGKNVL